MWVRHIFSTEVWWVGKKKRVRRREAEGGPECEEVVVFSEEGYVPDHVRGAKT